MSAKYKSPSFLLPNEINTNTNPLNTDGNPATGTGINSLYSMDFDGSSSSITIGSNISIPNEFTVSCWININTIHPHQGYGYILAVSSGAGFAIDEGGGGVGVGKFYFYNGAGTSLAVSTTVISANQWNNVAFVCNKTSNEIKCYINGSLDKTTTVTNLSNFNNPDFIGKHGIAHYINGKLDEIAIFNRALNTTEIAALYGGTSPNIYPSNLIATDLNPIAYYPLGEQAQMQGYLGNEASSEWQFPNGVLQDYVMDFDGNDDYVQTSGLAIGNTFTFSCWLNVDSFALNNQCFLSSPNYFTSGYNGNFIIRLNNNSSIIFASFNGNGSEENISANVPTISTGSWHHFALTNNGSTAQYYWDGSPLTTTGVNTKTLDNLTAGLIIGDNITGNNNAFNGKISNLAIWNTDQSTNIDNIYNNGSPQTTYTVAPQNWWKLNADSVYTPSAPNYTTALDFNGSSDYIDVGAISLGSTFSLSTWIKPNAFSASTNVVFGGGSGNYAIYIPSSTVIYVSFGGSYGTFTVPSISTTDFTHILFNRTGANGELFINGISQGTTSSLGTNSFTINYLGCENQTAATRYYFDGELSNAAIFNTALTPSQVSTLFNFGTPETNISFSPQAWWKLDDQTAITDSSGNGNTGTNNGAVNAPGGVAVTPSWKIPSALPITSTPSYTTALDFDGSDYIDCGTSSSLKPTSAYSISGWFKLDDITGTKTIISNDNNNGYMCWVANDKLWFYHYDTTWRIFSSTTTLVADTWYHFVLTWNLSSTTGKMYINGVYDNQGTNFGQVTYLSTPVYIGTYGPSHYFEGNLSNISMWNTALTPSQVSTLYNAGTPETAISFSPVSWWKLDTGGSIITDSAGSNNGTNSSPGAAQVTSDVLTSQPVNGVSTTLPSTALQQSDLQFDSPYSNYSLYFDGTGDYINCGNDTSLNWGTANGTVSCWFKTSYNASGVQDLVINGSYGFGGKGYILYLDQSERVGFALDDHSNPSGVLSTSSVNDGNWHHVVGVRDSGTIKLYLDGSEIATGTDNTGNIDISDPLIIGAGQAIGGSVGNFFKGYIDETSIFNYALSSAQILEIYNNGRPNDLTTFSGTAPISWWRLGENAYFDNNSFIVPNSITGAPNGTGAGTITTMISADAPGTYANGIGTNLDILDRVGDAPLSTSNSQSYNMIPSDISPYVPQYVGKQIANNFSMTFDGTNYFTASSKFDFIQQTGIFSISTWIKMSDNTSATNQVIAGTNYTGSNVGWQLWIDNRSSQSPAVNKTLKFHLWNSSTNLLAIDQVITDNDWNLITITGDGTTIRAYKNGSLLSTTQSISGSTSSIAFSDLRIGANTVSSPSVFFNGQIDEVAIFDTALNAGQIFNDLYQPTATATATNQTADLVNNPNLPTPVAWYRMGD